MNKNNSIILLAKFVKFGGTKTSLENLLNFYKKTDYNISVIFFREDKDIEVPLSLRDSSYSLKIINKNKLFFKYFRFLNIVLNLFLNFYKVSLFLIKIKPKVLVVSDWGPSEFLFLTLLPIKTINIIHSYPIKKRKFIKYFVGKKDLFLTVSNYSKKQIIDNWLGSKLKDKVKVVYNCLPENKIEERKITKPLKILTLGHVVWYKNPYVWLEVANRVISENLDKDIEFIWAGDGDLFDEINMIVKNSNIDNIKFIGYQKDVKKLYTESFIYFQPSKIESFGLSVAEAMYYKIPCVVSSNGGLPELIIDGVNGFIVSNDIDKYVEKISLLLNDKELNLKMGQAGSLIFEDRFTERIYYNKMKLIHENIINRNK